MMPMEWIAGGGLLLVLVGFCIWRMIRRWSGLLRAQGMLWEEPTAEETEPPCAVTDRSAALAETLPGVDLEALKRQASEALRAWLSACNAADPARLQNAGDALREETAARIARYQTAGKRERFELVRVHACGLAEAVRQEEGWMLTFCCAVGYVRYVAMGGQIIEGDERKVVQTRYRLTGWLLAEGSGQTMQWSAVEEWKEEAPSGTSE